MFLFIIIISLLLLFLFKLNRNTAQQLNTVEQITLYYNIVHNINIVCLVPFSTSAARMYCCDIICWDMVFSPPCPILKSVRHTLQKVWVLFMASRQEM